MPLVREETPAIVGSFGALPEAPEQEAPDFFAETIPSLFRQENVVGSILEYDGSGAFKPIDQSYDPYTDVEGYEDYADSFIYANSPEEVARVKQRIDRELEDRDVIARSGWAGVAASFAVGFVDPINLIPFGGAAYRTYRMGDSILTAALSTGRAGLLGTTAQEALLHHTQETRTWGESAANITAATFLSGVLGAGAGALSARRIAKQLENELTPPPVSQRDPLEPGLVPLNDNDLPEVDLPNQAAGGSVGAASVRDIEHIANEKIKGALGSEALLFQDPVGRTVTSPSIETRKTVQGLAESPLAYEKNSAGIPTDMPVETTVKMHNVGLFQSFQTQDRLFVQYRLGREQGFGDLPRLGVADLFGSARREGKLTFQQFRDEIGRAMRNGDNHEIPEVAQAAKEFRRLVFDPLKNEAIAAKLLDEGVDVKTAQSYLTRVYNRQRIKARRPELQRIIARWLKTQDRNKDLEDIELGDLADEIIDRILSTPDGRLPYDAHHGDEAVVFARNREAQGRSRPRGALGQRVFEIPDNLIEDFLESDIEFLSRVYTRTLAPDVELAKKFGTVDLEKQIGDIRREYAHKISRAETEAERKKLAARQRADIRDIAAMRDRIRGTYALPQDPDGIVMRGARVVRSWNYMRLLGGMTLSAVPDMARPVMVHGFGQVLGGGLAPMVKNMRALKLAANEVREAGTALDMVLDSRAMAIADVADDYGRHTAFERGVQSLSDQFGLVSLMAPWNAAMKQFSGVVTMSRLLKNSRAWRDGKISGKQAEYLAQNGIGADMARRIAKQFDEFGETSDGVMIAHASQWADREAARAFRGAVVKDVDRIIITPGQDRPLWMSTELGKVFGQFRSFSMAATQRMLVSGLQQRDVAFLNGLMLSVGLGALSYYFKTLAAGREVSEDLPTWVAEGVDRSGVTGWLFDVNNIAEKMTRGRVGVSAITGGPQMSRYASRNAVNALMGPTFGTATDAIQVVGSASANDWRESDTRALRRLAPWQNLFYLRWLLNQAEEGINGALGIE